MSQENITTNQPTGLNSQGIHDRLMQRVSLFRNAMSKKPLEDLTVGEVLGSIQAGSYRDYIEPLRKEYQLNGKSNAYSSKKRQLQAITFAGSFAPARKKENLKRSSGFVICDLDRLENVTETKERICGDPYTAVCFLSPSGDGLKVLVAIPFVKDDEEYKQYLPAIARHYEKTCGVKIDFDKDGKDISRLCFISYDPQGYLNRNARVFTEKDALPEVKPAAVNDRTTIPSSNYSSLESEPYREDAVKNILNIIYRSYPGIRHHARLKAGFLAGGYVAGGVLTESDILPYLAEAVKMNTDHQKSALKTLMDAYKAGQKKAITKEVKQANLEHFLKQHFPQLFSKNIPSTFDSTNTHLEGQTKPLKREESTYNLTELGNTERFLAQHRENVRFNYASNSWMIWNQKRWMKDEREQILILGQNTIRSIYEEVSQIKDYDLRQKYVKWALKSERHYQITNMLLEAKPHLPISENDFDTQKHLINLANGTYNLHTGNFYPHRREDYLSKIININYDPKAKCPLFRDKYLPRVFNNNSELTFYIQQSSGYTLSGYTDEQCFFFAHGSGCNGKTVFFTILTALLGGIVGARREVVSGGYFHKASQNLLTGKTKHDYQENVYDLPMLAGKRLVIASEIEENRKLAESRLKDLTGQDPINTRFLYARDTFSFVPVCKIWMYGNHRPDVKGCDQGIWRRFHLIPFEVQISEEEKDRRLAEKLLEELPGILNWAIEGYQAWEEKGLVVPEIVKKTTQEYQQELDIVGQYLDECCIINSMCSTYKKALYEDYINWCEKNSLFPIGEYTFTKKLKEKKFSTKRGTGGPHKWIGLGLKSYRMTVQ